MLALAAFDHERRSEQLLQDFREPWFVGFSPQRLSNGEGGELLQYVRL